MNEVKFDELLKAVYRNGAMAFKLSLAEELSKQGALGMSTARSVIDHPLPEYGAAGEGNKEND